MIQKLWLRAFSMRNGSFFRSLVRMMNCVEHGPEHIAFKIERTQGFALKLRRIAIFQRDCQCLVGISPRKRDPTPKVIESASINPRIKFLTCRKAGCHQIGRKELGERRCNGDRPRLSACEIHVRIDCETNSGEEMTIAY